MTADPREIAQRIREREFEIARKIVAESAILNSLSIVAQTTEVDRIYAILAAHYELVPDMFSPAVTEFLDDVELRRAAVSEEQPARMVTFAEPGQDFTCEPPAAHRATIAMIPCADGNPDNFHIEVDGVPYEVPGEEESYNQIWCGTEAEAKAKLESLGGENNGA